MSRASGSVAALDSLNWVSLLADVAAALESCIRFMVCWILSWKLLFPAVSVSDRPSFSSFTFLSRPSDGASVPGSSGSSSACSSPSSCAFSSGGASADAKSSAMPCSRFWAKASSMSMSRSDALSPGADCDAVAPLVFSAVGVVPFEGWSGTEAALAVALLEGLLVVSVVLEN